MKKRLPLVAAAFTGLFLVALWLVRYAAFAVLLFLQPLVSRFFGIVAGASALGLLLGAIICRDQAHMLWLFLGAGVAAAAIAFCYDMLLLSLAPGNFPMILVR